MNWVFYALLAPAVYTLVNFLDKYLLSKYFKNYNALPVFTAIIGFIVGSIFWLATGRPTLSLKDTFVVLSSGIITSWSLLVYYKALSFEETSKVIILFQMTPLAALVLSFFILGEVPGLRAMVGFILVLVSSIAVSTEKNSRFRLSTAFFLILLYDFLWATSGILMKFASNANSFSKIISYESWGVGLGGIMIYLLQEEVRRAFHSCLRKVKIKPLSILFSTDSLYVVAKACTFFAFSLGPVALVSVLENTQMFYGIFLGWLLTVLFPKVFHEDISKKTMGLKIASAIVLIIGIYLIT